MKRENWFAFVPYCLLIVIICIAISQWGDKTITTVKENMLRQREHTIIIDAGHGGVDGGATSCTGVLESQLNLEIALRLECLLRLLGMDTVMIRTTDTSIYTEGHTIASQKVSDLKQRVKIVNETENAILVSIHQNYFADARYGGAQVFYADSEDSKELATILQTAFVRTLNPGSRRVQKSAKGVYLMEHIDETGVLVECGFISNPQEEAKLRSTQYQQRICCVIASGLSQFINA